MGENLPRQLPKDETFSWEKDGSFSKPSMEAMKTRVKQLDPKDLPAFLAQVSRAKEMGTVSWEYMILLYEVVARVCGINVVPHIDEIMKSVITTLGANVVSSHLQQACSKVVVAIARYGIEPTTLEDEKRRIIHSLCKPLSDFLVGSRESLTSGAALCLEALVHLDNWQFAADEMVNRVCQNAVAALGHKSTQSDPHMGLVMSLAEHNPLIVEAYARLLIQSGLQILHRGVAEENAHKRRSAIQMIHILMKCLDPRSVYSELKVVTEEMELLQSDSVQFVRGAALEARDTAIKIATEEEIKLEKDSCSIIGSNFRQRRGGRRIVGGSSSDRSSRSVSPESHVVDGYSLQLESPISSKQASPSLSSDRSSVTRKLWSFENGTVDISLKDGLFSGLGNKEDLHDTHSGDFTDQTLDNDVCNCIDEFQGFGTRSCMNEEEVLIFDPISQDSPGEQDSSNIGSVCSMQTPIRAVEVPSPDEMNVKSLKGRIQRLKSMPTCRNKLNFTEDRQLNGSFNIHETNKANTTLDGSVEFYNGMACARTVDSEPDKKDKSATGIDYKRQPSTKAYFGTIFCVFFLIVLVLNASLLWINLSYESDHLVPT
ncbi:hypothetical protein MLD38_033256 [Melastoma candidum]|uniref:Uncharacterized protein n=1 Tax=Melastoma candidum TaxID=119954 RepID=A0ACB9MAI1_9MYRT|nr:hypothetical protein MLD38_033256 [Melastoma candidum]